MKLYVLSRFSQLEKCLGIFNVITVAIFLIRWEMLESNGKIWLHIVREAIAVDMWMSHVL